MGDTETDTEKDLKMKMRKVIWLSRHEMLPGQKEDLERVLGELEWLPAQNVFWAPDDDCQIVAEFARLRALVGRNGVLAGVFPPVALSVARKGVRLNGLRLFSPVSAQTRETRTDGEARIEFHHVRWVEL